MPTRAAAEGVVDPAAATELGPDSSAGDLARWRLTTLGADLARHAQEARRGEPDGVHRARVTCRRLRAALATLRPVLPRDASDPIRAELRWLARALGDARDCEVAHARLVELLDAEPTDVAGGPVGERIAEHHRMTSEAAARRAEDALDSPRCQQLADALELLAGHPLEHPDRVEPALALVRLRVGVELGRVRQRMETTAGLAEGPARDDALHAVRRAAKRLRYACELAEPVTGPEAARLERATHRLTRALGVRQDTQVTRHALALVAGGTSAVGERDVTYRRMREAEARRAEESEAQALRAWRDLDRPELVGWLG